METLLYKEEAYNIIGACMEVHKELGSGFLEPVYQEALGIEFSLRNIDYQREVKLDIYYKDKLLSKQYIVDFICFGKIIVELKTVEQLNSKHLSQLMNYLKATGFRLGLLINFGNKSLDYKRIVF